MRGMAMVSATVLLVLLSLKLGASRARELTGDDTGSVNRPTPLRWRAVSASYDYTCGILADTDELRCWGVDDTINQTTIPKDLKTAKWASVSAGQGNVCGILKGINGLRCWGDNPELNTEMPGDVAAWSQVAVGYGVVNAITKGSNKIRYWPIDPGTTTSDEYPPKSLMNATWAFITSENSIFCGILAESQRVKCWGFTMYGDPYNIPKEFQNQQFLTVATTTAFACGILKKNHHIRCWGGPFEGHGAALWTKYDSMGEFKAISVGGGSDGHVCALTKATGALKCWLTPYVEPGCMGPCPKDYVPPKTPAKPEGSVPKQLSGVLCDAISTGYRHNCCILAGSRELKCWGTVDGADTSADLSGIYKVPTA